MAIDIRGLDGKVVVITGGGRGTGRALALVLADAGCRVVLFGRDETALAEVAATIEKRGGFRPVTHACDMGNAAAVERACLAVRNEFPTVDILINNAAAWLDRRIEQADASAIADTISSAVTGTVLATKFLLPALRASDGADIVNLISVSGLPEGAATGLGSEAFIAAKHGQTGFSESLRHSLAASGIRVLAIYPPDFAGVQPDSAEWETSPGRRSERAVMTTRDVVEAILFAVTRPRIMTVSGIVLANNG
ncbi:MAG: SDR family oxidoreductase [Rhodospirillaceae bacterium]|nr:SDR family oxidoreductase [Rhodospirillaceae bacterium]